jgi:hypothetical protein
MIEIADNWHRKGLWSSREEEEEEEEEEKQWGRHRRKQLLYSTPTMESQK